MGLHGLEAGGAPEDPERGVAKARGCIGHEAEFQYVVQVGVGEEDYLDLTLLVVLEAGGGTRVDENGPADLHGDQAAPGLLAAVGTQNLDVHPSPSHFRMAGLRRLRPLSSWEDWG